MRQLISCAIFCGLLLAPGLAQAAVIINEVLYDDGGTDDREFVELFNNGITTEAIGGWTLGGQDQVGPNSTVTITAGTMLAPGAFYVIGYAGVGVNQTVTGGTGFWENDSETLELRNAGVLMDAVVYESNKGPTFTSNGGHGTLPADVVANAGPGYWGNTQSSDLAGTPLRASAGLARWVDGRDVNNNGRDFGFRPVTPGASNNPVNITAYSPPDVSSTSVGTSLSGFAYSFVPPRVIDPTAADANNPNAIPAAPITGNRAIVAWDPSGGGNGVSTAETFATAESSFDIFAYLDTRDLPQMFNASNLQFRGSEVTTYGIGSADALSNLTNLSGQSGVADTDNSLTGIAWVYEKVAAPNPSDPLSPVSEKLYLVDANNGGDAGQLGSRPVDWTILATVDLSTMASDWYRLGIKIDALGNGLARFDNQFFAFTTAQHSGAFSVGYRENTQLGSDGSPDAILRPATFTIVPEPGTIALLAIALIGLVSTRRR